MYIKRTQVKQLRSDATAAAQQETNSQVVIVRTAPPAPQPPKTFAIVRT